MAQPEIHIDMTPIHGYLKKLKTVSRPLLSNWVKRYWRIEPARDGSTFQLSYYADDETPNPTRTYEIADIEDVRQFHHGDELWCFRVETPHRSLVLKAHSQVEMNGWIDCIHRFMEFVRQGKGPLDIQEEEKTSMRGRPKHWGTTSPVASITGPTGAPPSTVTPSSATSIPDNHQAPWNDSKQPSNNSRKPPAPQKKIRNTNNVQDQPSPRSQSRKRDFFSDQPEGQIVNAQYEGPNPNRARLPPKPKRQNSRNNNNASSNNNNPPSSSLKRSGSNRSLKNSQPATPRSTNRPPTSPRSRTRPSSRGSNRGKKSSPNTPRSPRSQNSQYFDFEEAPPSQAQVSSPRSRSRSQSRNHAPSLDETISNNQNTNNQTRSSSQQQQQASPSPQGCTTFVKHSWRSDYCNNCGRSEFEHRQRAQADPDTNNAYQDYDNWDDDFDDDDTHDDPAPLLQRETSEPFGAHNANNNNNDDDDSDAGTSFADRFSNFGNSAAAEPKQESNQNIFGIGGHTYANDDEHSDNDDGPLFGNGASGDLDLDMDDDDDGFGDNDNNNNNGRNNFGRRGSYGGSYI